MSALTPLGIVHTAISLVAVGAGVVALVRDRRIAPSTRLGQVYLWATATTRRWPGSSAASRCWRWC